MENNLLEKASILLTPTAYNDGKMLSVKPNENLYGSELITNGDFATDSDWTKQVGWSIENGKANALNSSQAIYQAVSFNSQKQYKISYTISNYVSGDLRFVWGNIVAPTNNGNGTYTQIVSPTSGGLVFYLAAINSFTGSIDNISVKEDLTGDFTFSRSSAATRVNAQGLVEEITDTDLPRIDYTDGCGSWLLEPQSTNLVTYSSDFSDSNWIKTNSSITSNLVISPDGALNADKLVEDASTGEKFTQTIRPVSNTTIYTASVFVKFAGREWIRFTDAQSSNRIHFNTKTGVFGAVTGTVISYNSIALDNGWYKLSLTTTSVATAYAVRIVLAENDNDVSYTGDGTSGVYIWGAQLEQQSYATSYIPTNGATNTRLQDIATNSGNSTLINSTEGVLYVEIAALADDDSYRYMGLTDGTANNRVMILYYNNNDRIRVLLSSSGTKYFDEYYTVSSLVDFHKIAVKWKVNDFALWIDGVERATDTSGSVPIGLNTLAFDQAGGSPFYGKCKALAVFKEALTDAQLQSLTTI